jgi:uncharacterized membrane protein YedE/YeeE
LLFGFCRCASSSYTLVHTPQAVVWLQSLDGIGAGIYGVVVVALAADLTLGKGHFNSLMGLFATALAASGAILFTIFVPETKPSATQALATRTQIGVTR